MVLLSHVTAFETLFGKLADYSLRKVFGCIAYASTSSVNRTMFNPRAHPCIFKITLQAYNVTNYLI